MDFSKLKKLKFWSNDVIEFYCREEFEGVIPEPKPAAKFFPEWYKNLEPYYPERDRNTGDKKFMTAKKCLPLIDAMSLGFILPLGADCHVMTNHDNSQIRFNGLAGSFPIIEAHSKLQIGGQSSIKKNNGDALKFLNYWIIKTAPGWSSLFIPPINNFNQPFTCLGGMVDTDRYIKEINFPAVWHAHNFDGMIYAGTPLVTVIPIKRNSFSKKPVVRKITKEERKIHEKMSRIQGSRLSYYTNELRVKK